MYTAPNEMYFRWLLKHLTGIDNSGAKVFGYKEPEFRKALGLV